MVFQFNKAQMRLAKAIEKKGIAEELMCWFLLRCGTSENEWQAMREAGVAINRHNRFWLSKEGKREFRKQSKGVYY